MEEGGTPYTVPLKDPFVLLLKLNSNVIAASDEYWMGHNSPRYGSCDQL